MRDTHDFILHNGLQPYAVAKGWLAGGAIALRVLLPAGAVHLVGCLIRTRKEI